MAKLEVLCPHCGAQMAYRSQSYRGKGTNKYTVKKYECEVCGQIDFVNANGVRDIDMNPNFGSVPKEKQINEPTTGEEDFPSNIY